MNLLMELQIKHGLTYIFITHNLNVVRYLADYAAIMYLGRIVESGPVKELFQNPKHPYTQALLSAIPNPDPKHRKKHVILSGDVPSAINPPSGCPFHTRCPQAMDVCRQQTPVQTNQGNATTPHLVSCHLYN